MLICIVKATNRIIEMQSGATAGTLLKNAIAQGYNEKDIIEKEVTPLEYQAALKVDPVVIAAKADALLKKQTSQAKADAIIANFPTWAQVATAADDISSLAEAKIFIKKLARVTYWLAKNQAE